MEMGTDGRPRRRSQKDMFQSTWNTALGRYSSPLRREWHLLAYFSYSKGWSG